MLLATVGYSIDAFLTREAETALHFPVASNLFIRGLVHTIFSLAYFVFFQDVRQNAVTINRTQKTFVAIRSLCGALGKLFLLFSLRLLPLGDAISLGFVYPTITVFLSAAFLHESITALDLIAVFATFSGILLVSQTHFETFHSKAISPSNRLLGTLCSLSGAIFVAISFVIVRHLGTKVHYMVSVISYSFCMLIAAIFLNEGFDFVIFESCLAAIVVMIGSTCGFFALVAVTMGLQRCQAGAGAILMNMEVPLSYVFGILFLKEKPDILRLFGSALILSSAVALGVRKALLIRVGSDTIQT